VCAFTRLLIVWRTLRSLQPPAQALLCAAHSFSQQPMFDELSKAAKARALVAPLLTQQQAGSATAPSRVHMGVAPADPERSVPRGPPAAAAAPSTLSRCGGTNTRTLAGALQADSAEAGLAAAAAVLEAAAALQEAMISGTGS
jgi:hypothetical protein